MINRFDFTKDKLRPKILILADLNGYEKPSTYLNDILHDVEQLNDDDYKFDFYINICHLCIDMSESFWNEEHKKDITKWLKESHIKTTLFDRMWDIKPNTNSIELVENKNEAKTLGSTLKPEQVNKIFTLTQTIKLFETPITENELNDLFSSTLTKKIKVRNNQNFAALFNCLCNGNYISKEWQSVIGKNENFVGARGAKINANNLAVSNNNVNKQAPIYKQITSVIEKL